MHTFCSYHPRVGTICTRNGQFPHSRQFNFSVPAVRDYYINAVIAEVAAEDGVDVGE